MLQGYLAIVVSMLIWGSVGVFGRKAGQDPLITVTYRVLFAAASLLVVALLQSRRRNAAAPPQSQIPAAGRWRQRITLVISGLALAVNWLFFFQAVDTTNVSNAVLSYYAAPVIVALASPLLLGEKLERRTVYATAIAFSGVFVMLYQPGQTLSHQDMLGIGYGLIAAFFYAMVTITARWLAEVPPAKLVLIQTLIAAAALVPIVIRREGLQALAVPSGSLGLLAVVGVVHTALALFLYFRGLQRVKVQHVGVLAYLDPVSAVLFAYLFLGEVPSLTSLLGGALVLGGSALLLERHSEAPSGREQSPLP